VLKTANMDFNGALRREGRVMEGTESALDDISRTRELCKSDLAAVQSALETIEKESRKPGEMHMTARLSF